MKSTKEKALKFEEAAFSPGNPRWEQGIRREQYLKARDNDPRSEFIRDYNRLLHCLAYRRLKHKTQVFSAPENDHICTRIEHVNHVTSISNTIASALGLNTELANAIAIGHDIGHAPFGHDGEKTLNTLSVKYSGQRFWHERNSLWFADSIETLPDEKDNENNLALTYAVRDGIICHCGEVHDSALQPREEYLNLYEIKEPGTVLPYTWEGCVVKVADTIAYLGRDIEDALRLKITTNDELWNRLSTLFPDAINKPFLKNGAMNNTNIIHHFVMDLCTASDPQEGLRFSQWHYTLLTSLKKVSEELIYQSPRMKYSKQLVTLVLQSIFDVLSSLYPVKNAEAVGDRLRPYPSLQTQFPEWLIKYTNLDEVAKAGKGFHNATLYDSKSEIDFYRASVDFIASMTDNFALKVFSELTGFR